MQRPAQKGDRGIRQIAGDMRFKLYMQKNQKVAVGNKTNEQTTDFQKKVGCFFVLKEYNMRQTKRINHKEQNHGIEK